MPTKDGAPLTRYHLNALFDLELGRYPVAGVNRAAAEMSVLFFPFCTAGDEIVLDVEVADSYVSYLCACGLFTPGVVIRRAGEAGLLRECDRAEFWGWNNTAAAEAGSGVLCGHPQTDVVTKVNGRRFCSDLAQNCGCGVPGSRFFTGMPEFMGFLSSPCTGFPLVVKPAFGSSGYGFVVLQSRDEIAARSSQIDSYCSHGGFVAEPWCARVHDIGSIVTVEPSGKSGDVKMHRQLVNRYGAFYGIVIDSQDPLIDTWEDDVKAVSEMCSREAAAAGYHGPLGIDSFVYQTAGGEVRLAAGIEINARYTMGYLAHRLKAQLSPECCLMMRFIGSRRCRLPETCHQFENLMGENRYTPAKGRGILLLTPPRSRYKGEWRQPQRNVFVLVASDHAHLQCLDRFLVSSVHSQKAG